MEVEHGIYLDRDVVPGNEILLGDFHDHRPQINAYDLLNEGHEKDQAWPANARESPEREHDSTLVLTQHTKCSAHENEHDKDNNDWGD